MDTGGVCWISCLFCVSRAPWHRMRSANRTPAGPAAKTLEIESYPAAILPGSRGGWSRVPDSQHRNKMRRSMDIRPVPPAFAITPHRTALQDSPRKLRPRSLTMESHATAHPRQPVSRSPPVCLPSASSSPWARVSTRSARPQVRPTSRSCPGNPRLEPCVPHVRKEPGTRGKVRETIPVSFLRASSIPSLRKQSAALRNSCAGRRGDPRPSSLFTLPRARTFASSVPQGETQGFA